MSLHYKWNPESTKIMDKIWNHFNSLNKTSWYDDMRLPPRVVSLLYPRQNLCFVEFMICSKSKPQQKQSGVWLG